MKLLSADASQKPIWCLAAKAMVVGVAAIGLMLCGCPITGEMRSNMPLDNAAP